MTILETLMSRRWIVKDLQRELYYQVKDGLKDVKRFIAEKLGYQLIVNPSLIKLEKIPARPERWMGIREFTDPLQYVFLCMILSFLEEKDSGEQFVLSELTEYIQAEYRQQQVDWTLYQYRRHLVRTLKFCASQGMLKVNDGKEEHFATDYQGEVLYENTGISRYFMKTFPRDISNMESWKDFTDSEWIGVDEDRGIVRRQRVYRRLLMSMALYREGEVDEDFHYVKQYRNMMAGELAEYFDCDLQVHRTSAFLILGENGSLGETFPKENTLSDVVLLCNSLFLEQVRAGKIPLEADESAIISQEQFQQIVESCKERFNEGFVKTYREKTTLEFYHMVRDYMEEMAFIELDQERSQVRLRPILGKIVGQYPEDFGKTAGGQNEQ